MASAVLNSFGFLPNTLQGEVNQVTKFLILMVMANVGLGADIKKMSLAGINFLYAGLTASLVVALVSFGLIKLMGIN